MIYIDPPYNTGNDSIYKDNRIQKAVDYADNSGQKDEDGNRMVQNTETNGRFHTDWLNMLYPRLKIAKDFLSDDGVIFISIDDNEQENLKKICVDIFGQENFIGMLSVENNPKGRKNSAFISVSSEYCLIFAKDKKQAYFVENVPKNASDMTLDENGRYVHNSGKRVLVGENSFNNYVSSESSDKNYSVYFRESDYSVEIRQEKYGAIDQTLINAGYQKYYSYRKGRLVENTYSKDHFMKLFHEKALSFANGKIYEKNFSDTIRMKSQLVNKEYEAIVNGVKQNFSMELTTTGAGTYLKELFNLTDVPFTAPKNPGYLKMLISLLDGDDFLVMDFFSGSSTTADAVMQLNSEDRCNRKYIMVQLPVNLDEAIKNADSQTKKTIKNAINFLDSIGLDHNICNLGEERIRRAGKKIKEETGADIDYGFRCFKVDSSNMKDVYYRPADVKQSYMELFADNIKEDRTPEDLLFQVMLDLGILLSSKIEKKVIAGKKVFSVADGYLLACFDEKVTEEVVTAIAKQHPYYAVFRDSSMADSSVAANFEQIFKTYSPNTVRKVL